MTDLLEADEFAEGILQLEVTDPAIGGVPNVATRAGVLNIPLLQLAGRTLFLRNRLKGTGGETEFVSDLNSVEATGFYECGNAATGHPEPGAGRGEFIHLQASTARSQMFFLSDGVYFIRHYTDGGGWTAWERLWGDVYGIEQVNQLLTDGAYVKQSDYGDLMPDNNFDDALENGTYYAFGGTNGTASLGDNPMPESNSALTVVVQKMQDGTPDQKVVQTVIPISTGEPRMYVRAKRFGDWSPWSTVWAGPSGEEQFDARLTVRAAGMVGAFATATPPEGWLECDGSEVSRLSYSALFDRIGTRFGAGDGATTFALPDLRGEFIRGVDDGRGIDTGRILGSAQGDAIRNIEGSFGSASGQDALFGQDNPTVTGAFTKTTATADRIIGDGSDVTALTRVNFDASTVVPTANENRPRNVAMLFCIRF